VDLVGLHPSLSELKKLVLRIWKKEEMAYLKVKLRHVEDQQNHRSEYPVFGLRFEARISILDH
jgi:hypothetical protein